MFRHFNGRKARSPDQGKILATFPVYWETSYEGAEKNVHMANGFHLSN
jgi:hypothetical protein